MAHWSRLVYDCQYFCDHSNNFVNSNIWKIEGVLQWMSQLCKIPVTRNFDSLTIDTPIKIRLQSTLIFDNDVPIFNDNVSVDISFVYFIFTFVFSPNFIDFVYIEISSQSSYKIAFLSHRKNHRLQTKGILWSHRNLVNVHSVINEAEN